MYDHQDFSLSSLQGVIRVLDSLHNDSAISFDIDWGVTDQTHLDYLRSNMTSFNTLDGDVFVIQLVSLSLLVSITLMRPKLHELTFYCETSGPRQKKNLNTFVPFRSTVDDFSVEVVNKRQKTWIAHCSDGCSQHASEGIAKKLRFLCVLTLFVDGYTGFCVLVCKVRT